MHMLQTSSHILDFYFSYIYGIIPLNKLLEHNRSTLFIPTAFTGAGAVCFS